MSTDKKQNEQDAIPEKPTAATDLKQKYADEKIVAAHEQADADIAADPEISLHSPNDDLDEGETALLGDDKIPVL